jgi:hypothetical protein
LKKICQPVDCTPVVNRKMELITNLQTSRKTLRHFARHSAKEERLVFKNIGPEDVSVRLASTLANQNGESMSDIGDANAYLKKHGNALVAEADSRIARIRSRNRELKQAAEDLGLRIAPIDKRNNLGDPFEVDDGGAIIDVLFRILVRNTDELAEAVSFIREKNCGVMSIGGKSSALKLGEKTHEARRAGLIANIGVQWETFSDTNLEKKNINNCPADNLEPAEIQEKYKLSVPADYQDHFDFHPHPEIEKLPIAVLKSKDYPTTNHRIICRAGVPVQTVNDFANCILRLKNHEFVLSSDLTSKHDAHAGATLSTNGKGGGRIGLSNDAEIVQGSDANGRATRYSKRYLAKAEKQLDELDAADTSDRARTIREHYSEVKTSIEEYGAIEEIAGTNGVAFAVSEQQFELNAVPRHSRGFYIMGIRNMEDLLRIKNQLRIFADMHPDGSVRIKEGPLVTAQEILGNTALNAAIDMVPSDHSFDSELKNMLEAQPDGSYNLFVTYRDTGRPGDITDIFLEGPLRALGMPGPEDLEDLFENCLDENTVIQFKQPTPEDQGPNLIASLRRLGLTTSEVVYEEVDGELVKKEIDRPLFTGIRVLDSKRELPRAEVLRHAAPGETRRKAKNNGDFTTSEDKDHYCPYLRMPEGVEVSPQQKAEAVKRYQLPSEVKAQMPKNLAALERLVAESEALHFALAAKLEATPEDHSDAEYRELMAEVDNSERRWRTDLANLEILRDLIPDIDVLEDEAASSAITTYLKAAGLEEWGPDETVVSLKVASDHPYIVFMKFFSQFAATQAEILLGRNEDNYKIILLERWPDLERYDYGHALEPNGMPKVDHEGGVNLHERLSFPKNSPYHRHDGPETEAGIKKAKKYHQMDLFALDGVFGIEVRIPEKSLVTNSEFWHWFRLKYPQKAERALKVISANGIAEDGTAVLAYRLPPPTPGTIPQLKGGLKGLMNKEVLAKYESAKTPNEKYKIIAQYLGPVLDIADESHRGAMIEALVGETTRLIHEKLNLSSEQYPFFVGEALEVPSIVTRNLGDDAINSGRYKVETITVNSFEELDSLKLEEDQDTFYAVEIQGLGVPKGLCIMIAPRQAISESWDRTQQGINKTGFRNLTDMVKKWPYGTEETPNTPLIALLGLTLDQERLDEQEGKEVPYKKINLTPGPTAIVDDIHEQVEEVIANIDTLNEKDFSAVLQAVIDHVEFGDGLIAAFEAATQVMQMHAMSLKTAVDNDEVCPIYICTGSFSNRNFDIANHVLGKDKVHSILLPETTSPATLMDYTVDSLIKVIDANEGKMPVIHMATSETSVTTHVYPHQIVDALKARGLTLDKDYCLVCDITSGAAGVDYARDNGDGTRSIPASAVFFSCQKAFGLPPGEAFDITRRDSPLRKFKGITDDDLAARQEQAREFSLAQRYADSLEGKVICPLGLQFMEQALNGDNVKTPAETQAHARKLIALWGAVLMDANRPHNTHLAQDSRDRSPNIHGEVTTRTNAQQEIRAAHEMGVILASLYGNYGPDGNRKLASRVSYDDAALAAVILHRLRELDDIRHTRNPLHPTLACREPILLHRTLRWLAQGEISLDDILMSHSATNYVGNLIHTRNAIRLENGALEDGKGLIMLPSYGITEENIARLRKQRDVDPATINSKLNTLEQGISGNSIDIDDDFTLNIRRLERIETELLDGDLHIPISVLGPEQKPQLAKLAELVKILNDALGIDAPELTTNNTKTEYRRQLSSALDALRNLDNLPYHLQADFRNQATRYKGEILSIANEILRLKADDGTPIEAFAEEMHRAELRIRDFIADNPEATYQQDDEISRKAIKLILEFQARAAALADILDKFVTAKIDKAAPEALGLHQDTREARIPFATTA